MSLSIFDVIGWLIEAAMDLASAVTDLVMRCLSAVARMIFGPLTRGADCLHDLLSPAGPWIVLVILGGAAAVLLLLAVLGWAATALSQRNRK